MKKFRELWDRPSRNTVLKLDQLNEDGPLVFDNPTRKDAATPSFYRWCFFVFLSQKDAQQSYEQLFLHPLFDDGSPNPPNPPLVTLFNLVHSLYVYQPHFIISPELRAMPHPPVSSDLKSPNLQDFKFPNLSEFEVIDLFIDRFKALCFRYNHEKCDTFEAVRKVLLATFTPSSKPESNRRDEFVIISAQRPLANAEVFVDIPNPRAPRLLLRAVALWCISVVDGAKTLRGFYSESGLPREAVTTATHVCYGCYLTP